MQLHQDPYSRSSCWEGCWADTQSVKFDAFAFFNFIDWISESSEKLTLLLEDDVDDDHSSCTSLLQRITDEIWIEVKNNESLLWYYHLMVIANKI